MYYSIVLIAIPSNGSAQAPNPQEATTAAAQSQRQAHVRGPRITVIPNIGGLSPFPFLALPILLNDNPALEEQRDFDEQTHPGSRREVNVLWVRLHAYEGGFPVDMSLGFHS